MCILLFYCITITGKSKTIQFYNWIYHVAVVINLINASSHSDSHTLTLLLPSQQIYTHDPAELDQPKSIMSDTVGERMIVYISGHIHKGSWQRILIGSCLCHATFLSLAILLLPNVSSTVRMTGVPNGDCSNLQALEARATQRVIISLIPLWSSCTTCRKSQKT